MDPRPGTAPALVASARTRSAMLRRLTAATAQMNTATLTAMTERHVWFSELDPESRSWIGVLARTGIDGFVTWFAGEEFDPESIFDAAPRAMARRITLAQTVDLVRTTTDVVEEQIAHLLPRSDRQPLQLGIVHYSREVAFAAAAIYAKAAEARGAWDSRIEATIVDAVVRAETDESVLSRASTLGWPADPRVVVRLVCILGGPGGGDAVETCERVGQLAEFFAPGPIVVGPTVDGLAGAHRSARSAASGYRAAKAWPEGPRTLLASDLLPERALAGDGHARRILAGDVYPSLAASKELLETCVGFLDCGSSMEATARALFVHPNTVRYRLKRIQDLTGYNPADAREAFVLRMAITLGRLQD